MIGQQTARFCSQGTMLLLALSLSACAGGEGPKAGYAPAPGSYVTVPVNSGDTASAVARRYHVQQDDVLAMNGLNDAGQRLTARSVRIPAYARPQPEEPQAQTPAETLDHPQVPVHSHYTRLPPSPPKAAPAEAPAPAVASAPLPKPRPNGPAPHPAQQASAWLDTEWFSSFIADVPAAKPGSVTFVWPLQGRVLSGFGANLAGERNDGINIAAARGAPIHAAADGTVTYVGDEIKAYGNLILIRHDNGYVTAYAHSEAVNVERGEHVTRGQIIAYAGATGDVDRPQLHFELRAGTKPVDPKAYLMASK